MASATNVIAHNVDYTEDDTDDCIEFFPGFLSCLKTATRKKYLYIIHNVKLRKIDNPFQECHNMAYDDELKAIRDNNPSAHYILLRELAGILNFIGDHDSAVQLVKEHINGDLSQNYWMYLLLGQVYEEMATYADAIEVHKNAIKATGDEELLKKAVATMKLAVDVWHQVSPALGMHHQNEAQELLKQLEPNLEFLKDLTSEEAILYLDAYKTSAYMFRIQEKFKEAIYCSTNVLNIISLDPKAIVQAAKIHLALASYTSCKQAGTKYLAEQHIDKAEILMDKIIQDHVYMQNHSDSVIHSLSKLAHSAQQLGNLDKSLTTKLQLLDLTKMYLGETHPEIARTSSDVALLHYLMKNMKDADEYIEITENALEDCGFETDITKKKLYIRELSDALRNLGNLFTTMSFYSRAEAQYKRCIDLNKMVYREKHQRTARVLRSLGQLYVRWGKFPEAEETFNECLDIHNDFRPQSESIISKIHKDQKNLEKQKGRKRPQRY